MGLCQCKVKSAEDRAESGVALPACASRHWDALLNCANEHVGQSCVLQPAAGAQLGEH